MFVYICVVFSGLLQNHGKALAKNEPSALPCWVPKTLLQETARHKSESESDGDGDGGGGDDDDDDADDDDDGNLVSLLSQTTSSAAQGTFSRAVRPQFSTTCRSQIGTCLELHDS